MDRWPRGDHRVGSRLVTMRRAEPAVVVVVQRQVQRLADDHAGLEAGTAPDRVGGHPGVGRRDRALDAAASLPISTFSFAGTSELNIVVRLVLADLLQPGDRLGLRVGDAADRDAVDRPCLRVVLPVPGRAGARLRDGEWKNPKSVVCPGAPRWSPQLNPPPSGTPSLSTDSSPPTFGGRRLRSGRNQDRDRRGACRTREADKVPSGPVSVSMVSVPSHSWQTNTFDAFNARLARILDAVVVRVVRRRCHRRHAATRTDDVLRRRRSRRHRRQRQQRRGQRRRPDVFQRPVEQLLCLVAAARTLRLRACDIVGAPSGNVGVC